MKMYQIDFKQGNTTTEYHGTIFKPRRCPSVNEDVAIVGYHRRRIACNLDSRD